MRGHQLSIIYSNIKFIPKIPTKIANMRFKRMNLIALNMQYFIPGNPNLKYYTSFTNIANRASLLSYCRDTPYRHGKRVPLRTSDCQLCQIHRHLIFFYNARFGTSH